MNVLFIAIFTPPPIGIENCVREYCFLGRDSLAKIVWVPCPSVPKGCKSTHSPLPGADAGLFACGLKWKIEKLKEKCMSKEDVSDLELLVEIEKRQKSKNKS